MILTADVLRVLLAYDAATGRFEWLKREGDDKPTRIFNTRFSGREAGCLCPRGYRYIRIRGSGIFAAGRLAWLWVTGDWPEKEIDHKDGDPSNNRWPNLREVSRSENAANRGIHKNNQSGFKGVTRKRNGWSADIRFGGKRHRLGQFATAEAAGEAFANAARELHGEFARLA